jgi:hypothetical protein
MFINGFDFWEDSSPERMRSPESQFRTDDSSMVRSL